MAVATPTLQIGDAFKNRKTTMPLIDDLVYTKSTAGLNRRGGGLEPRHVVSHGSDKEY